jgi:hypothetical protein
MQTEGEKTAEKCLRQKERMGSYFLDNRKEGDEETGEKSRIQMVKPFLMRVRSVIFS